MSGRLVRGRPVATRKSNGPPSPLGSSAWCTGCGRSSTRARLSDRVATGRPAHLARRRVRDETRHELAAMIASPPSVPRGIAPIRYHQLLTPPSHCGSSAYWPGYAATRTCSTRTRCGAQRAHARHRHPAGGDRTCGQPREQPALAAVGPAAGDDGRRRPSQRGRFWTGERPRVALRQPLPVTTRKGPMTITAISLWADQPRRHCPNTAPELS